MYPEINILYKSLIKPFYKENAGTLVLVFTMFFFIIGTVDGAGLFKYHFGLIKALLSIKLLLLALLLCWFFYTRKAAVFMYQQLRQPAYQFLYVLKSCPATKLYGLFFFVHFVLLLPMTFYIALVIIEGLYLHYLSSTLLVCVFLLIACAVPPIGLVYKLKHPEAVRQLFKPRVFTTLPVILFYPLLLFGQLLVTQKIAWMGIKIYTCAVLYFMAVNNELTPDGLRFVFMFFSLGVLANTIFVFRIRAFEEQYLSFYRTLPLTLSSRLMQYSLFSLTLLLPEIVTCILIAPVHLNYWSAFQFAAYGISTILLAISVCFSRVIGSKQLVKLLLFLFFAGYFIMMASGLLLISMLFLISAIILFRFGYYKFEDA